MAPARTWTDDALATAVKGCRSWRGVQREVGLQTASVTRRLRNRANELGLDYAHFTAQRTWSDNKLRAAVAASATWTEVAQRVGIATKPGSGMTSLKRHVQRLGLDTAHFGYPRSAVCPTAELPPFTRSPQSGAISGLSTAARWFLDRGYLVSVPLEPAPYDLIVESDDGLKKVQVKTTRAQSRSGRYTVRLARTIYDPAAVANAAGKYRQVAYPPGVIDYFFIVANGDAMYLIPYSVVEGQAALTLDAKYAGFKA